MEALLWPVSEAKALLLDGGRLPALGGAPERAGARLEQRFGYGLAELARRFDRSVSWVSRGLGLVELLPEGIQQLVREGKIAAQGGDEVSGASGWLRHSLSK